MVTYLNLVVFLPFQKFEIEIPVLKFCFNLKIFPKTQKNEFGLVALTQLPVSPYCMDHTVYGPNSNYKFNQL